MSDIVEDLREVWEFPSGGNLPVQSQGSRSISYKQKALQRIVDCYGAYLNHMIALTEDSSVKGTDKAHLRGYVDKWKQGKTLIGAALYVDALKAPSLLSLCLQNKKLDILSGIQQLLRSSKYLKTLSRQNPLEWPTVKLICCRMKEENGKKVYQGAVLTNYQDATLKACSDAAISDITTLESKMRTRLEWSDLRLLRAIIAFLDTKGWCAQASPSTTTDSEDVQVDDPQVVEVKEAVEYITSHFREPLEAKNVDLSNMQDEVEEIVLYARRYLNINTEKTWYNLYTSTDSQRWPNLLRVCDLIFSLPFSNAHAERLFSTLKIVKTERHTRLQADTLTDLLDIKVEGPPLANFDADQAISLWWSDCKTVRRVNQAPRKEYRPRKSTDPVSPEPGPHEETLTLEDWDDWFHVKEPESLLESNDG